MLKADPPLQVAKNSFQLDVGIDLWRSQNSCFERGSSEGAAILRHVEAVDCRVFRSLLSRPSISLSTVSPLPSR